MIEIIPNWHPVFVHFTVALLSLAVIFHVIHIILPAGITRQDCYKYAQWNLWLGTGLGIVTAMAGWYAYNSVAHDAPSHAAMTEHRNWALATLIFFILLTGWSIWKAHSKQTTGGFFLVFLLAGGGLLLATAWHGGELVYRYGLGVMSLPEVEEGSHNHGAHTHSISSDHDQDTTIPLTHMHSEMTDDNHGNVNEEELMHQAEEAIIEMEDDNTDMHADEHPHVHSQPDE